MPIKRVTDILIGKDVSSGDGFLSVLDENQAALTGVPTIGDSPVIYIKQQLGSSGAKLSLPIHGKYVRNWSGRSAANAANQVTTLSTVNVSSDQEYGLYVTIVSDKELSQGNRRFYVQYISDSSATEAEICAGIVANGNANTGLSKYVTFSGGTTTIVITGNNPGVYFEVGKAIGFSNATTVTLTTKRDPGQGTYDLILALEEICKGYEGYMGERRTFVGNLPGFSRPTYYTTGTALAVTGVYDLYIIDHDQPVDNQGMNDTTLKPTTTYIAVVAGSSTFSQANFETVLNSWMESTPGNFNAVNL